jgi:hypothetical protein
MMSTAAATKTAAAMERLAFVGMQMLAMRRVQVTIRAMEKPVAGN